MSQNLNKKICLIVECLSLGGAERVAGMLSIALVNAGYKVVILSVKDDIVYDYSGELFTIEVEAFNKIVKQLKKLKKFKKAIIKIDADYYLDFRFRGRFFLELMLHFFVLPKKNMIFTHHSGLQKLNRPTGFFFNYFYDSAIKNIAVSKTILSQLPKHNQKLIYNFVDSDYLERKANEDIDQIEGEYIIALSRLVASKQIDRLIETYVKSILPQHNIKLLILGEGKEKGKLQALVKTLKMEGYIIIKGFVNNPYPYIKKAQCMVQCSLFEGFPMVLIESLVLATPVIAFNCPSGPSEIIKDKFNGRLIPAQHFDSLKESMNTIVEKAEIFKLYSKQAKASVEAYMKCNIVEQWINLFENEN